MLKPCKPWKPWVPWTPWLEIPCVPCSPVNPWIPEKPDAETSTQALLVPSNKYVYSIPEFESTQRSPNKGLGGGLASK